MKTEYTQIIFKTPEARVKFAEGSVEIRAEEVVRIFRGLQNDASDGTFALWSQDDLIEAIVELDAELHELDAARLAAK